MISRWRHTLISLATLATLLVGVAAPAPAGSNFTESQGCGVAGYRGPLAGRGGWLPTTQEIYGPFADFFGRTYHQVESQMVNWTVPGSSGRTVKVHIDAMPAFRQVADNLAAAAAAGKTYRVDSAFGWGFRTVTGESQRMSFHAFGTAVDINPPRNPYVPGPNPQLITDMPPWYVQAWQDAGFCWGGDWVSIKDAMHFSWMGPAATPGYGDIPAPSPPTNSSSQFTRVAFNGSTVFAGNDWEYTLIDRSRDGAPDLYAWRWLEDGLLRLEVAGAISGYQEVGIRESITVDGGPGSHGAFFADYDNDNRADLWVFGWDGGAMKIYGDSGPSGNRFTQVLADFAFSVPGNARVMAGEYNRDGVIDLYLVRGSGQLQVFDGASGFSTKLLDIAAGTRPIWNRFGLADYGFDGISDLFAVSKVSQRVYIATSGNGFTAGPAFNIPVSTTGEIHVADYDGDGRPDIYHIEDGHLRVFLGGARTASTDLTFWYQTDSLWDAGPECFGPNDCDQIGYVDEGREFSLRDNLAWDGGEYEEFFFGTRGDISLVGDWDCDGVSTPGMFRPSNGFVYLTNQQGTGAAEISFHYGIGGDIPVVGDWDGDGCDSLAIYRPGESRFYGSNSNKTQPADFSFNFGRVGDRPLSGDFNGDGRDDFGLHRPTTGLIRIVFEQAGPADLTFYFGAPGDTMIVGDWDGDGIATLGVHRNDEGRWYFRLENSTGTADHVLRAGPRTELVDPVVGVW